MIPSLLNGRKIEVKTEILIVEKSTYIYIFILLVGSKSNLTREV